MLSLRRLVRAVVGRDWFPRRDAQRRTERFGSAYGGWEVAVEGIDRRSVVYSFGIGEDVSFDLALIERFRVTVHAFDPTPRSLRWLEAQRLPPELVTHEYGLANRDESYSFFPPVNPSHISHTVLDRPATRERAIRAPMKRLGSIMAELGHDHIDLLKLDIEGGEYAVIDELERSSLRPEQILVEFHHRFPGVGIGKTQAAIAALRRMGYGLFAVSRSGEEYGLLHLKAETTR